MKNILYTQTNSCTTLGAFQHENLPLIQPYCNTFSFTSQLISVSEPCLQASKPARQRVTLHWLLPASLQLSQGAVTIDFTLHPFSFIRMGIQERRKFVLWTKVQANSVHLTKTFELFRAIYRTHKLKICTVYNFRCFRLHKATLLITK